MTKTAVRTPDPEEPEDGRSGEIVALRSFRVSSFQGLLRTVLSLEGQLIRTEVEASPGCDNPATLGVGLRVLNRGLILGIPLGLLAQIFVGWRDESAGTTDDPDLRFVSSIIDYVARRTALDYLSAEEREGMGVLTVAERLDQAPVSEVSGSDAPYCSQCGQQMVKAGLLSSCFVCMGCGTTSGCS